MGKPVNIAAKTTAHAQAAEFAALAGGDAAALTKANNEGVAQLRAALAQVDALTAELEAEKEAHAKTQAALTAATSTEQSEEPAA